VFYLNGYPQLLDFQKKYTTSNRSQQDLQFLVIAVVGVLKMAAVVQRMGIETLLKRCRFLYKSKEHDNSKAEANST